MKPNHIHFTEKSLADLSTPAQGENQAVYYDKNNTDGLCVIITYGGTKTYYAYMKHLGRPCRVKIGRVGDTKLVNARKKAHELKELSINGKDPSANRRDELRDMTLKTFYETQYKPRHGEIRKKESSQARDETIFNNYLSDFHSRKMITIKRDEIERLHNDLNKRLSPYTANRMLSLLRHMYNIATIWGYPADRGNPTAGIHKFPEKSRDRFLSPDELTRFFAALNKETHTMFKNYVLLSLFIGQRADNMISMRWDNIDLQNGFVYFPDTKNNEPHRVPLSATATKILTDMKKTAKSGWVFPAPWDKTAGQHIGDFRNPWIRFREQIGMPDLRIHDLRRTLGSYQAIEGASLSVIGKSLGHKSLAATNVYARLLNDPVLESMQKAEDKMLSYIKSDDTEK
ncbi:MAG: site-specific integrase [Rickettsiales bacterium]|jgi:integrase|nr:site-specific integrase [Rickettsiales bacterium]